MFYHRSSSNLCNWTWLKSATPSSSSSELSANSSSLILSFSFSRVFRNCLGIQPRNHMMICVISSNFLRTASFYIFFKSTTSSRSSLTNGSFWSLRPTRMLVRISENVCTEWKAACIRKEMFK